MRSIIFITVLSLLYTTGNTLHAQDTLHWNPQHVITWADFKGTDTHTELRNDEMACTTSGIAIDIRSSDGRNLYVTIYTLFYPGKSYTKTDSSTYLLLHERGHFDLAELYARKMRKEMMELTPTSNTAVAKCVQYIISITPL